MSDRHDDASSSDWTDKELEYFRWRLEQFSSWPENAAELLEFLRQIQEPLTISEEDEEMLSLVVDDALRGTDIAARYPTFFRKLLGNEELRYAFLDSLDLLENSRAGTLVPLPQPPSRALDFLHQNDPEVTVEKQADQWRLTWRQTAEQLSRIFSLTDLTAGQPYRLESSFMENESFVLFHHRAIIEAAQLDVALEAAPAVSPASALQIMLFLTISGEGAVAPALWQFSLKWGAYEASARADANNRVIFPPLPLSAILDSQGETVVADLYLSVASSDWA